MLWPGASVSVPIRDAQKPRREVVARAKGMQTQELVVDVRAFVVALPNGTPRQGSEGRHRQARYRRSPAPSRDLAPSTPAAAREAHRAATRVLVARSHPHHETGHTLPLPDLFDDRRLDTERAAQHFLLRIPPRPHPWTAEQPTRAGRRGARLIRPLLCQESRTLASRHRRGLDGGGITRRAL